MKDVKDDPWKFRLIEPVKSVRIDATNFIYTYLDQYLNVLSL